MLSAGLDRWDSDPAVRAVVIAGAGERAFCAGGDIKSSYRTGMAFRQGEIDSRIASLFFGEEYQLNKKLFHYKKPLIALMNGITMGGGYGIAGPCRFRLASSRTTFAMPEVGIGFFPDVGGVYYLNRCADGFGSYLALSGNAIEGHDMHFCGLATDYVRESLTVQDLVTALAGAFEKAPSDVAGENDIVKNVLQGVRVHYDKEKVLCIAQGSMIATYFASGLAIEKILEGLAQEKDAWAEEVASVLCRRSPTSLKVTARYLDMARTMDFDDVMEHDFRLAQSFLGRSDYYEGVRAAVIDKDRKPRWSPETLQDVTDGMVESYFSAQSLSLSDIAA